MPRNIYSVFQEVIRQQLHFALYQPRKQCLLYHYAENEIQFVHSAVFFSSAGDVLVVQSQQNSKNRMEEKCHSTAYFCFLLDAFVYSNLRGFLENRQATRKKKQLIQRIQFKSKANWYSKPLGEGILCIYLYSQEHVHSILTVTQNRYTVKQ